MNQPIVHIMCGLPGSGKSHFIENEKTLLGLRIHSFDHCVLDIARKNSITYSETFKRPKLMKEISELCETQFKAFSNSGRDFIIDMTNLTEISRKIKLKKLQNFHKIIYVFTTEKELCWEQEIHYLPIGVFEKMSRSFTHPTHEEGFDEILFVDKSSLKKPYYIIDIDGTIANISHRLKYIQSKKKIMINFMKWLNSINQFVQS